MMALTPSDHVTILFFNCSDISTDSARLPTSLAHFPHELLKLLTGHVKVTGLWSCQVEDPKTVPLVLTGNLKPVFTTLSICMYMSYESMVLLLLRHLPACQIGTVQPRGTTTWYLQVEESVPSEDSTHVV